MNDDLKNTAKYLKSMYKRLEDAFGSDELADALVAPLRMRSSLEKAMLTLRDMNDKEQEEKGEEGLGEILSRLMVEMMQREAFEKVGNNYHNICARHMKQCFDEWHIQDETILANKPLVTELLIGDTDFAGFDDWGKPDLYAEAQALDWGPDGVLGNVLSDGNLRWALSDAAHKRRGEMKKEVLAKHGVDEKWIAEYQEKMAKQGETVAQV